ncbi:MAG: hypothetical protein Q4F95_12915 [Oscillospiraceae bacterium]|nr:hypothetical protein [Oscillospiraceae bacterium]
MFTIQLAQHYFCIDNRYQYIQKLCHNYITGDIDIPPVRVSSQEIEYENRDKKKYHPGYLESLAVYRKICTRLISDNIILFHCSALKIDGEAVLFTAPSGTGKSTHAALWRQCFGDRVRIINDDKPLIMLDNDKALVYGTPWSGKHGLDNNESAPVSAVFFLEQAKDNSCIRISPQDAYPVILNQTFRPDSADSVKRVLSMTKRFSHNAALFRLRCNMSAEAADVAYSTWKGKKYET